MNYYLNINFGINNNIFKENFIFSSKRKRDEEIQKMKEMTRNGYFTHFNYSVKKLNNVTYKNIGE